MSACYLSIYLTVSMRFFYVCCVYIINLFFSYPFFLLRSMLLTVLSVFTWLFIISSLLLLLPLTLGMNALFFVYFDFIFHQFVFSSWFFKAPSHFCLSLYLYIVLAIYLAYDENLAIAIRGHLTCKLCWKMALITQKQ